MKSILLLAAISLLTACASTSLPKKASTKSDAVDQPILALDPSQSLWDDVNEKVSGVVVGWSSRRPEVTATYRTKLGDFVKWESWGPKVADFSPSPNAPPNHNSTRYARFPRAYRATLRNPKPDPLAESAEFDLYDVGAQRRRGNTYIRFQEGTNIVLTVRHFKYVEDDGTDFEVNESTKNIELLPNHEYVLPPANYAPKKGGDFPEVGITLSFTGEKCVFWIAREPGRPDGPGGSPPPPDPGDDTANDP